MGRPEPEDYAAILYIKNQIFNPVCIYWYIEPLKWPSYWGRRILLHFLERKHLHFDCKFIDVCGEMSNWQLSFIKAMAWPLANDKLVFSIHDGRWPRYATLSAWSAPSHYLNQCWNIVNWTLRNKLQWNFNRNYNISIQENAFDNVVRKLAAILSRPQWVKTAGKSFVSVPISKIFKISRKDKLINADVW